MQAELDNMLLSNLIINTRTLVNDHMQYRQHFEEDGIIENNDQEDFLAAYYVAVRLHFMLRETLFDFEKNKDALKSTLKFLTSHK
tara:strand:+ start:317 stop:571 length:255 start_codon:yes stop_codon:yes gene_type:complete